MLSCTAWQTCDQTHLINDFKFTVQAIHMQQAADQENVSSLLNPAPVSATAGQTAVTQVVTSNSKKHSPLGQLTQMPAQQIFRFRHDVDLQKHPKVGFVAIIMLLQHTFIVLHNATAFH